MNIRGRLLLFFILLFAMLMALAVVLWELVNASNQLANAEKQRYDSHALADELRQSSDDLTRMARTYVVTGDPSYEQYFREILAIRDGEQLRPDSYQGIYWDFITRSPTSTHNTTLGRKISIIELMKEQGFTEREFEKLEVAKVRSDALVNLENRAMLAVKGRFDDGSGNFTVTDEPNLKLARDLLHGDAYHKAKAEIMTPIQEFFSMVESRTQGQVNSIKGEQQQLLWFSGGLVMLLIALCLGGYLYFSRGITHPLSRLLLWVHRMENGDYQLQAVDNHSGDELDKLTQAFAKMAGKISGQISKLNHLATHDVLTGAATMRLGEATLESFIANAKRTATKVGLIFMDLDGFKGINDTYGHAVGDQVLTAMVTRSRRVLRETDLICRVGGDEFICILPNFKAYAEVMLVAEKLGNALSEKIEFDGGSLCPSVSMGMSVYPDDGDRMRGLIRKADESMYDMKRLKA
ncbi:MAG: diguanylate cyclase [Sedimenticola sp.]